MTRQNLSRRRQPDEDARLSERIRHAGRMEPMSQDRVRRLRARLLARCREEPVSPVGFQAEAKPSSRRVGALWPRAGMVSAVVLLLVALSFLNRPPRSTPPQREPARVAMNPEQSRRVVPRAPEERKSSHQVTKAEPYHQTRRTPRPRGGATGRSWSRRAPRQPKPVAVSPKNLVRGPVAPPAIERVVIQVDASGGAGQSREDEAPRVTIVAAGDPEAGEAPLAIVRSHDLERTP